ncbi:GGDEF domain-containing protein [Bacillus salacetis]|uniref:GGDEF domain-containing protein n=1 Tax=Bacillus salacetis TaxID=2315464 RepID=A0A3A1QUM7_9BACI|nr:GGDEF domain-containing protein [Bacillus salacetis]RIW31866.1 GGDEF domain-containing protein [Bacillus salacetis]
MTNIMPMSIQKLKYRFYAVLLPVFLFVACLGWYEEVNAESPDDLNLILLPILVILFFISTLIVFFKKSWIETSEKIMVIAICIVSAIRFTHAVSFELERTMTLGPFTYWMPMFYMFLFFLLNTKWALLTTISTYVWFLGVALYKLPVLIGTPAMYVLVHYFFANLVFIVTLFFLQTVKQNYIKAEVLEEMANTDYLTGLPNRRKIDQELILALDKQQKLAIIYLDIDYFKQINDTYGHTAGDRLLKEFTVKTLEVIGEKDFLGRWGGEEFMLILNDRDLEHAYLLAEKIRKEISENQFEHLDTLTASFGVTERLAGDTLDTLLNRADKALYEAKNRGRNRVVSINK